MEGGEHVFRARRIKRGRAIAGTAALGGAMYYAKRVSTDRRKQAHEPHDATPPPEPVGPVKELAELREQGILTEEEFFAEKRKLLGI